MVLFYFNSALLVTEDAKKKTRNLIRFIYVTYNSIFQIGWLYKLVEPTELSQDLAPFDR